MRKKLTTEEFIRRAREKHGDTYDYSNSMYTGIFDKIEIICHVHGSFVQTAHDHLYGGCTKCVIIKMANSCRKNNINL